MTAQLAASLGTQVIAAALTFAQSWVLVRFADPIQFGQYALTLAIWLSAATLQNALIITQMAAVLPGCASPTRRTRYLCMFAGLNATLAVLGAAIAALVTAAASGGDGILVLAAAAFAGAMLHREFGRWSLFVCSRGEEAVASELLFTVLAAATTAALWFLLRPSEAVLLGTALPILLAGASRNRAARAAWSTRRILISLRLYRRFAANAGWALVGAAGAELQQRAHVYATHVLFGPATLGLVQAGRVPFGPFGTLIAGFMRAARPHYGQLLARGHVAAARHLVMRHTLAILGMEVILAAVFFAAWPIARQVLFGASYPGVERYAVAWAMALALFCLRSPCAQYLQAQQRFREMALVGSAATAACLFGLAMLLIWRDPLIGIAALVMSESTILVAFIALVVRGRSATSVIVPAGPAAPA